MYQGPPGPAGPPGPEGPSSMGDPGPKVRAMVVHASIWLVDSIDKYLSTKCITMTKCWNFISCFAFRFKEKLAKDFSTLLDANQFLLYIFRFSTHPKIRVFLCAGISIWKSESNAGRILLSNYSLSFFWQRKGQDSEQIRGNSDYRWNSDVFLKFLVVDSPEKTIDLTWKWITLYRKNLIAKRWTHKQKETIKRLEVQHWNSSEFICLLYHKTQNSWSVTKLHAVYNWSKKSHCSYYVIKTQKKENYG